MGAARTELESIDQRPWGFRSVVTKLVGGGGFDLDRIAGSEKVYTSS